MRPNVRGGRITAGGLTQFDQQWSDQARSNFVRELQLHSSQRDGTADPVDETSCDSCDPEALSAMVLLHNAVGQTILTFKVGYLVLPAKQDAFDWTLGEAATRFGEDTGYDYALFTDVSDFRPTGGRVTVELMSVASCVVGFCAPVFLPYANHVAFASLVDLSTGQVVWFNHIDGFVGNAGTEDGARELVERLMGPMYR
ncbi:MAG: hypothetical protein AAFU65_09745 [Pseudomonadota bacterium]